MTRERERERERERAGRGGMLGIISGPAAVSKEGHTHQTGRHGHLTRPRIATADSQGCPDCPTNRAPIEAPVGAAASLVMTRPRQAAI
jgi:hypothetical protein